MEETLGKRIAANRKKLGMTQDALAEKLGVTAQAVSKWENDQSCPDITMLPKLAQIFSTSTDILLGLKEEEVPIVQILPQEAEPYSEPEGLHLSSGDWEFKWDSGRKGSIRFGLWVLLVGALMILSKFVGAGVGFFDLLWPSALLVFGLFGIYPRFSLLRLGCGVLGAGLLLDLLELIPFSLDLESLLPVFLLLAGVHLIWSAVKKPQNGFFHITRNGENATHANFTLEGDHFDCNCSFGENRRLVSMPRLSSGKIQNSFAETQLDFRGCEEFAKNCTVDITCAFGELELLIPRHCRVVTDIHTGFASVDISGHPDVDASSEILLSGSVAFGEIKIRYL